jgi:putative hydrolase of HD superfamily
MSKDPLHAIARYFYEIGHLKYSKRSGWWLAGVKDPESVAEHSFRVAVIGYVLAVMEGADPAVTAAICLFHDTAETRLGDIPSSSKRYLSHAGSEAIVTDQVRGFPQPLASSILALIGDYQSQHSHEAQLAKDADRLECLIQAREYEDQGFRRAREWMVNNAAKVHSDSARRLATICLEAPSGQWWDLIADEVTAAAEFPQVPE